MKPKANNIRVALVVPHIFMHRDILPHVIFSPGVLARELAEGLSEYDIDVTFCTPGVPDVATKSLSADMSYFERELAGRDDTYVDLLKKHPFTFVSLARQVQSELIADVFSRANNDEFDVVHIYTNEEDVALPFAKLCTKPVVFTHHDPFNFMVKYKSVFPKYPDLNWLSISMSQRSGMPPHTNWVANIYHGIDCSKYKAYGRNEKEPYVAYLGRIIEPKGVHLAIEAVETYNKSADTPIILKIAGKHYSDSEKDTYWREQIEPRLSGSVQYVGFIKDAATKNEFLGRAKALLIPSTFDEPFGMVMIEALASGTPIIGLDSGAIPEIVTDYNGSIIHKSADEHTTVARLSNALNTIDTIDPNECRKDCESRFSIERMCQEHASVYRQLATK